MNAQRVVKIWLKEWKLFLRSPAADLGFSGGVWIFFESETARLRLGLIALAIREYKEIPSVGGEGVKLGLLHDDVLKVLTQCGAAYEEPNMYANIRPLFDPARFKIDGHGYKIGGEDQPIHNPQIIAQAFSGFARTQNSGTKEHLVLRLDFSCLGISLSEAETPDLDEFLSRKLPLVPRGHLTPETPIDTTENWSLWIDKVRENRILADLQEIECAVVYELSNRPIILEYESKPKYTLPPPAKIALDLFSAKDPEEYKKLEEESWGLQVRMEGIGPFDHHTKYSERIRLSPINFLHYVAVQARLWIPDLKQFRDSVFRNALDFPTTPQLPSHFALHMAVLSADKFLLSRKRRANTELYPRCWEISLGEFMHGPDVLPSTDPLNPTFPHFVEGKPSLPLFLSNAVAEELNFNEARPEDFSVFGFVMEWRTLAPKLLVIYSSHKPMEELTARWRRAEDRAERISKIELSAKRLSEAILDQKRTWTPLSKLAGVLALVESKRRTEGRDEEGVLTEFFSILQQRKMTPSLP
jgi:hypothetical protein